MKKGKETSDDSRLIVCLPPKRKEAVRSNKKDDPCRYVINRVRADNLAELLIELEERFDSLKKAEKTVKRILKVVGNIAAEMYEGDMVECHTRKGLN